MFKFLYNRKYVGFDNSGSERFKQEAIPPVILRKALSPTLINYFKCFI